MHDEIMKIFENLELDKDIFNEDVMKQISLFIESKVGEEKATLKESLEEQNAEELSTHKEELTDQLDEYLNYFVEKYIEDNKEEITDSVKIKTAERVLKEMNSFVQNFNIKLNEDVVVNEEETDQLKEELNTVVNEKIRLEREIKELSKQQLVSEKAKSFEVESEKSTFEQIAENLDYQDDESFQESLNFLAEKIDTFKPSDDEGEKLEEKETSDNQDKPLEEDSKGDPMDKYLKFLTR